MEYEYKDTFTQVIHSSNIVEGIISQVILYSG